MGSYSTPLEIMRQLILPAFLVLLPLSLAHGPAQGGNLTTTTTSCGKRNKETFLKSLKVVRKVRTSADCQSLCTEYAGCTHFVWKRSKRVARRSCTLQKLGYKKRKNLVSGPVSCGLIQPVENEAAETCCAMKNVDGKTYLFLREDNPATAEHGCKDG